MTMKRRTFVELLAASATVAVTPWPPTRAARASEAARRQPLRVNGARLNGMLRDLAQFGRTPAGGVERLAYSDADRAARAWVVQRMREAGLTVRVDAAANIVGRREGAGRDRNKPAIMLGSHIDSVPDGGAYDGTVGSLGAIEVAWTLAEHGVTLAHPLEVVVFQNEEGGLYGSEAMVGRLSPGDLDQRALSGKTIREGIAFLGGDPARLAEAERRPGTIAAYVELHIEQGGLLEAAGRQIGVVEGIVGIEQWDVTVTGAANHAGTTPMDQRRDALVAAAAFVTAVPRIVRAEPGRQVGTVGRIEASPGAPNVIPGQVRLSLELRDLDAAKIQRLFDALRAEAERIGTRTGTTFTFVSRELDIVPALTDPRIREAIARAADGLGLAHQAMPSGAGHDAQSIAAIAPIGMIFIPSVGGISHAPAEFSHPHDIQNGANVLLATVVALDARDWSRD